MKLILTGLVLLGASLSYAQDKTNDSEADSTEAQSTILTLGAMAGNNASYYGQSSPDRKLPYSSFSLSLQHKTGLFASASLVKLLQSGSGVSEVDLSAGYQFDLSKKLSGSLSYTRFFYEENSPLLQTAINNTASSSLSYKWWLSTALYADYAFGNSNKDWFVTFENYKTFDLGKVFSDADYLTLEPSVQVTAGTSRFSNSYQLRRGNGRIPALSDNPLGISGSKKTETVTEIYKDFSLMTYNFKVPLSYNRLHYSVEAAYQLSVLDNRIFSEYQKYPEYGNMKRAQSFFTLSFNYYFFK